MSLTSLILLFLAFYSLNAFGFHSYEFVTKFSSAVKLSKSYYNKLNIDYCHRYMCVYVYGYCRLLQMYTVPDRLWFTIVQPEATADISIYFKHFDGNKYKGDFGWASSPQPGGTSYIYLEEWENWKLHRLSRPLLRKGKTYLHASWLVYTNIFWYDASFDNVSFIENFTKSFNHKFVNKYSYLQK